MDDTIKTEGGHRMDEDVGVVVVDRCSGRVLNRRLAQWRVDDVKQNNARCVGSKKEEKEASKPITYSLLDPSQAFYFAIIK